MKLILMLLIGTSLLAEPLVADRTAYKNPKLYRVSQFAAISAEVADIATATRIDGIRCHEQNGLLRSADGRVSASGYALGAGLRAGVILTAHWLHRNGHERAATVANFAAAATSLVGVTANVRACRAQ